MPFDFYMPDIGEGVVEGEIVGWKVKVGDTVKLDQPLAPAGNVAPARLSRERLPSYPDGR